MPTAPNAPPSAWKQFANSVVRGFHAYANWLVGISWKRFFLLSILLLIVVSILEELPPFSWRVTEVVTVDPPKAPRPPKAPAAKGDAPRSGKDLPEGVDISIDERGVRITPREAPTAELPASAPAPADAASPAKVAPPAVPEAPTPPERVVPEIAIKLPPGADNEQVREAIEEAREAISDAIEDAREAAKDAAEAARDAAESPRVRLRRVAVGDFLGDLALFWIFASAILKATYKGRLQAEVRAAQATETAEAEQLKRQVVEARMAAMQAQVEPHFLFNTLASIDHLIETDPPRASTMQKNLIALLRASMPTMREANAQGARDLGRELAVIRPYLEILKVRMEDRLHTQIDVPEGLCSAEFPPMMIQSLVENAIKHGLEPKPEGGRLLVRAQVEHGNLVVTVADTGLGFGRATATNGTGVGLANIRERLKLIYGDKAALTVTQNDPTGTRATITVPYRARPHGETNGTTGAAQGAAA